MKHYKVEMIVTLTEEAGHPRKWIPDAVYDSLETGNGEDIVCWTFTELSDADVLELQTEQ